MIETNVSQLWAEEVRPDQEPASGLTSSSSHLDAAPLAQHSYPNIQHKASVDLFVPANRLCQMLKELELHPNGALRQDMQSKSKLTNRRHRVN